MKSKQAISALEALAQDHRLTVFRALVQAGPLGLTPSHLSDTLDIPAPTLSFHLAQLKHAGLVSVTRQGRSLIYVASFDTMNNLIAFLTENCCSGSDCAPASCAPAKLGQQSLTRSNRRAS